MRALCLLFLVVVIGCIAAFVMLLVNDSTYAASTLITIPSFFGKLALYRVFRDAFPVMLRFMRGQNLTDLLNIIPNFTPGIDETGVHIQQRTGSGMQILHDKFSTCREKE